MLGGDHCRVPISACPVFPRTYDRCTVVITFATLPAPLEIMASADINVSIQ